MRRGREGFTLLETLVAFAIAATGLGAVFASFGDGAGQARRAEIATLRALEAWSLAEAAAAGAVDLGAEGRLATGERWVAVAGPQDAAPVLAGFAPRVVTILVYDGAREALRLDALRLDVAGDVGAGG